MSAIWALLHFDGAPVDPAHLERMGAALQPLGPERPNYWREGSVGLGQRQMILTPEDRAEQQPVVSSDGQWVLVYDGRLDNRPELAEALQLKPAAARLWPDSAYVLRAFQTWGEDCSSYLVGGLAFIVWEKQRRRLFAAVSPSNSCALFYHQSPQTFALASLPPGLWALPDVPRRLNESKMVGFLGGGRGEDRTTTFFEGLHRLPGGHTLAVENGALDIRAFWAPDTAKSLRLPRDEDYVETFNALFERVVSDHLRSASPVAVMMSGGLDSTSVAAIAAPLLHARDQRLLSLTSIPEAGAGEGDTQAGRFADETPYVQAVAATHPNLDLAFVAAEGRWLLDDLETHFAHHFAPPRAEANRVWLDALLRTAHERGCRVILTGEAGNRTLSWDGANLIGWYLRAGQLGAAWREARATARRSAGYSPWRALLVQGLLPLLPDWVYTTADRLRPPSDPLLHSPLNPRYVAAHQLDLGRGRYNSLRRPRLDPRRARFGVDAHVAGWRSQFGVDARDPTGDQRIVEFCLSIPHDQFRRHGEPRWLIRRAMAGRLPTVVLDNRQRGLQSADWLYRLRQHQVDARAALQRFRRNALAAALLDLDRLDRLVEVWPDPASAKGLDYEYRVLQAGLVAGSFILWAQPEA